MSTQAIIHAEASGRVNLIGEHTDYNDGFVLPTVIPQLTRVDLTRYSLEDDQVEVTSSNVEGQNATSRYRLGDEKPSKQWSDYIQGVTSVLQASGHKLGGFSAKISSHVPMGSGLSSSAALEVAMIRALREAFRLDINDTEVARLGQRVENEFVGARVGIMDQMAVSLARAGEALFLDTRDLSYRRVRIPLEKVELIVINSGVSHSNAHGGYNQRRRECEEACQSMNVKSLRQLSVQDLSRAKEVCTEVQFKRTRHVVTENERVLQAVIALEKADLVKLGKLFNESHHSLRDDYQVSVSEVDRLVEIAQSMPEVFGARMTGGGFGGSIVTLTQPGTSRRVSQLIADAYSRDTNRKATVLVP